MYQRTFKLTLAQGEPGDLLLRLDQEVAPLVSAAPGFIAYYITQTNDVTVFSTRVFRDKNTMFAEITPKPIHTRITADFGITVETIINGYIGVTRCFAPYEEARRWRGP